MIVSLICGTIHGNFSYAEESSQDRSWETYGLSAGLFVSNLNTSFRLGSGIGLDVDAEKLLNLDSTGNVFRINGLWRFSDNQRHRVDFSWFAFHRSGIKNVAQDIELDNNNGETVTIDAGTRVDASFDIDIFQVAYSYSFLHDDRIDWAAGIGLYVMPVDYRIRAIGLADVQGEQDFIAPLPTIGLRMDIMLAPKWYFRSGTQLFYLETGQFRGSLLATHGAVEYNPWKNVGFGLGADSFTLSVEADGEDYPSIDFSGNVRFEYVGIQLYTRIFY
jgi:hypothetical protein